TLSLSGALLLLLCPAYFCLSLHVPLPTQFYTLSLHDALPISVGFGLALLAVTFVAVNLRAGISSLAPVIGQVADSFGVSSSTAGFLTSLPGFCFAIMGWLAVPIAKRLGLSPTLVRSEEHTSELQSRFD